MIGLLSSLNDLVLVESDAERFHKLVLECLRRRIEGSPNLFGFVYRLLLICNLLRSETIKYDHEGNIELIPVVIKVIDTYFNVLMNVTRLFLRVTSVPALPS